MESSWRAGILGVRAIAVCPRSSIPALPSDFGQVQGPIGRPHLEATVAEMGGSVWGQDHCGGDGGPVCPLSEIFTLTADTSRRKTPLFTPASAPGTRKWDTIEP